MSKTVVGLFKSAPEAQNVKHELVNEGYPAESIRVVANEADGAYASGSAPQTTTTTSTGAGVMDSIKNFFHSFTGAEDSDREYYSQGVSRGGALMMVTVADERADALAALLERHGASDVNEESAMNAIASSTPNRATAAGSVSTAGTAAIPIVEEEMQVGKRQVQSGGVRVYSHMVETPVEEDVRLREEHVRVQRNAVNRPASEADFKAFQEGTVELTETSEEVVVGKQARVVEEVTVGKDVSERIEKVRDTVRHTEVEVEELPGESVRTATATTNK